MISLPLKKGDEVSVKQYGSKGKLHREILFDKVKKASLLTIKESKREKPEK